MQQEKQNDSFDLSIMPIGAGKEVGRSCIILEFQQKKIMLDCGIHMNKSHKGKSALPYFEQIVPEEIDLILITHFHLDHCGALPYFLKNSLFKGKIFMTRPTKEIYNLVLRDSIKVKSENLDQDIINETSIEQSLKIIEVIDYESEITYKGIRVKCYNAGHVLGAAMFMVEVDGIRVLYTGDYSTEIERHLRPAQIPNEKIHVLIAEATYGDTLHESREKREMNLLNEIIKTLKSGGNVLLPVFSTGRCHELLLILEEYWASHADVQCFPIYSTCTLAYKYISVFQKYQNKLGDRFLKKENIFKFNYVQTKKYIEDVLSESKPKVVMASPGLLQSGHSKQLFERWFQDPKSQVIITGQIVQDTIAWKLVNNKLAHYKQREEEVKVKIRAYSISFSAHADYEQTSKFINFLRPLEIVLVHGSAKNCTDLLNKIKQNFKGIVNQVQAPGNIEKVRLTVEKRNVVQSGCKAIGQLAKELEEFQAKFQQEPNQHQQKIEQEEEDCYCSSNELMMNGILLNTEHGFLLADENDKQTLNEYGISQKYSNIKILALSQLHNQMYVPFKGGIEQVYNLVKTVQSSSQIEFNSDDNQILIKPYLEIKIPLMQQSDFLQFKWISSPESDSMADGLAYLLSSITPGELLDIEKGRCIIYEIYLTERRQGLIKMIEASGFGITIDELENISITMEGKQIGTIDLNLSQIEFQEDLSALIKDRLNCIYQQFISLN